MRMRGPLDVCMHALAAPRASRCARMRMRRVGVLKYASPAHEHDVPRQLWRRQRRRLFFSPDAFRDYFGEQVWSEVHAGRAANDVG